ncbi:MAG: glutathione S-transferase family protein [Alphaproteobacteria bacterium]|nr:glutathione S-transferase family protein [Alphaproteobacteria bacterium]
MDAVLLIGCHAEGAPMPGRRPALPSMHDRPEAGQVAGSLLRRLGSCARDSGQTGIPMITVYQIPGAWGLSSLSPFCMKVTTALAWLGVDYAVKFGDPRKGPFGKVPYIRDEDVVVGDSELILRHIKERHGFSLDDNLNHEGRAVAHAVKRMVEEDLYWVAVYARWFTSAGWGVLRPVLLTDLLGLVRPIVNKAIRRGLARQLHAQGVSTLPETDIWKKGEADLGAVEGLLGDKPFLTGARPCSTDASLFGLLANIVKAPADSPLQRYVLTSPRLSGFVARAENWKR